MNLNLALVSVSAGLAIVLVRARMTLRLLFLLSMRTCVWCDMLPPVLHAKRKLLTLPFDILSILFYVFLVTLVP